MSRDELVTTAALYALGSLEGSEKAEFEAQVAGGSQEAREALGEWEETITALGQAEIATPPPSLKQRLLARVRPAPGHGAILKDEGKWRESGFPGVSLKVLFFDKEAGLVTTLVRMSPGSRIPEHIHVRAEQCLVLEGVLEHDGHTYVPGDFTYAVAGSQHPELVSDGGTLLLIIGAPEYKPVNK